MIRVLILSFLFLSQTSLAQNMGGHDGGGGRGVVCYDNQKNITSVEILDFFEGKILDSYSIPEYEGDYASILPKMFEKLDAPRSRGRFDYISNFYKGFKFLPAGIRLNPINDSAEILIPENCKVEQVANFQSRNRIFIVKDYWDKLSETNKAGLIVHEFLWMQDREAGSKISTRVRRMVAQLFAENFQFFPVLPKDPKEALYSCVTANPDSGNMSNMITNSFFVFKSDTDEANCRIYFTKIGRGLVLTETTTGLTCDSSVMGINFESYSRRPTQDNINGEATIDIQWTSWANVLSPSEEVDTHNIVFKQGTKIFKDGIIRPYLSMAVSNSILPGFDDKDAEVSCYKVQQ